MKKQLITLSLALFSMGLMNFFYGQKDKTAEIKNWYNGSTPGMNTEKAYSALKKKKSTTVIVAVIDSGIDIEHKDLAGKIWTNEKEIPGNGIDDDKNGYIDDMHGWNFLGGADGQNQNYARLEKVRILADLSARFEGKSESSITAAEKADFEMYKTIKKDVEAELNQNEQAMAQYTQLQQMFPTIKATLVSKLGENFTEEDVNKWAPTTPEEMQMKQIGKYIASGDLTEEALSEAIAHFESSKYQLDMNYNDRQFIGDDADNLNDIHYGNNDVEGPDALHGTHVGGIIGAVRHNDLGGDGVCENVKLMSLRAVPDGDEQDKDIALAIRYAVDNGAQVINMSFGKAYSKHPEAVYEAFKYAESKGVLLVHAAGNDGVNLDANPNFPTNKYAFQKAPLTNYLCIGASTRFAKGKLAADFSNFSQTQVDVFAPGFEIYNTVPQSDYKILQGTSMAAPMVTGVAALLKSYFPNLSMMEIKDIMLASAKSYKGKMMASPGTGELVDFGKLSATGGVIDITAAIKMCAKKSK